MLTLLVAVATAASAPPYPAQSAPGSSAGSSQDKPVVEILEKGPGGKPTKVRLDGQVYEVCTAEGQDGCINPREAGLKFGNRPADTKGGRPAGPG